MQLHDDRAASGDDRADSIGENLTTAGPDADAPRSATMSRSAGSAMQLNPGRPSLPLPGSSSGGTGGGYDQPGYMVWAFWIA